MAMKRMLPNEIAQLRSTLKLSEGEFATRIDLDDRGKVKLLESGTTKPTAHVTKMLYKLLSRGAGRSPKLKVLLETVRSRITSPY